MLRRVGGVLLDPRSRRPVQLRRLLVATDAFALAEEATVAALYAVLSARIDEVGAHRWHRTHVPVPVLATGAINVHASRHLQLSKLLQNHFHRGCRAGANCALGCRTAGGVVSSPLSIMVP